MKGHPGLLATLLLSLLPALPASAQVYGFLKYAPAAAFTDADWQMAEETVTEALDRKDDGETLEWSNPASGNAGAVTVTAASPPVPGKWCRQATVRNRTAKSSSESTYRFCRDDEGNWKAE
jgi:surface antigen